MAEIPADEMEKIRKYAKDLAFRGNLDSEDRDDINQAGLVGYLSGGSIEAAKTAMNKERKDKLDAYEVEYSFDIPLPDADGSKRMPLLLEDTLLEEPDTAPPTWVPRDPMKRMQIIHACANNSGVVRRSRVGRARVLGDDYEALITLLGHEYYIGRFSNEVSAHRALKHSYRMLQDWCSPIFIQEDQENAAERFVQVCAMDKTKPRVFYDDPLAILLFLEDFNERVQKGDIYYPETPEWALRKRIANTKARKKAA